MVKKKRTSWQVVLFSVLALIVFGLSMAISVHLVSATLQTDNVDRPERYRHKHLADAKTVCKERAREVYGDRIWVMSVDRLSSRYDERENRYKVFLNSELYPTPSQNGVPSPYRLYCITTVDTVRILDFYEQLEGQEYDDGGSRLGF